MPKPKLNYDTIHEMDYKTFLKVIDNLENKFPFAWKKVLSVLSEQYDLSELLKPTTPVPAAEHLRASKQPEDIHNFVRVLQSYSASDITLDDESVQLEQGIAARLDAAHKHHLESEAGAPHESLRAMDKNGALLRNCFSYLKQNPLMLPLIIATLAGEHHPK